MLHRCPMTINLKTTLIVVAAAIPLVISVLSEIRSHWFWDKRTSAYDYLTKVILTLWLLLVPVAVWAVYLQIGEPINKPKWRAMINGIRMPADKNHCVVTLPSTNNIWTVDIAAENIGDATADKVRVDVVYSAAWTNSVEVGPHWVGQPAVDRKSGRMVFLNDRRHYLTISEMPVFPNSSFGCPALTFRQQLVQSVVFPIGVAISSAGAQEVLLNYVIVFTPGAGDPHLE